MTPSPSVVERVADAIAVSLLGKGNKASPRTRKAARAALAAIREHQEPIAWRIRRGASDVWGYCDTESDADFLGGASGMKYVKEPLYAALSEGDGG